MVEPQCIPLIAFPKAWSPGTDGPGRRRGRLPRRLKTEADLDKFKGKLKGAIVLLGPPRPVEAHFEPLGTRLTDKELLELANAAEPTARRPRQQRTRPRPHAARRRPAPATRPPRPGRDGPAPPPGRRPARPGGPGGRFQMTPEQRARVQLQRKKMTFAMEEGAAAVLDPSNLGDGGTLFVAQATVPAGPLPGAGRPRPGGPPGLGLRQGRPQDPPADHRRQGALQPPGPDDPARARSSRSPLDLAVEFHDDDLMGYNTVAEIPGTDLKDEVVMLGGHMDSWHSGTGATDNAAGVSVGDGGRPHPQGARPQAAPDDPHRPLERRGAGPARLARLRQRALRPGRRRHPRPAMGGGRRLRRRQRASPEGHDQARVREVLGLLQPRQRHRQDPRRLPPGERGRPADLPPLARAVQEMGASTITISNTGGTDHQSFDGIGLPGFQFIQDAIEYDTRTHHSNQDVYDRIQADDMKQAAAIMAAFVYNTANRDEKLPRKPTPTTVPGTTPTPTPAPATTATSAAGN